MGSYVPTTAPERARMLGELGIESVDALYAAVPDGVKLKKPLNLPAGLSELEAERALRALAAENRVYPTLFRGAGAYRHYIPAVVDAIAGKEEFVTAYTPYQAELSQGVLQSIFEFQTMICQLTGMQAANASIYDGATAAAEAAAMCRERGRRKILVSAAANPQVIETMQTYCFGADAELILIPERGGVTDPEALAGLLGPDTACVYIQQPNYYGNLEDIAAFAEAVHAAGAKLVAGCNPIALALLSPPGECGADIAVGEGQPLGLPLAFGGPYLGFMACTQKLMRRLPGRIVGQTLDSRGERAFVLTLQAREQHIRREKASSNVCSNEALCALRAAVYLSAMGPEGLTRAAESCMALAHYAAGKLGEIPGFALQNKGPFFHEFVTSCPGDADALLAYLDSEGILGGLPLEGAHAGELLWCCTEMNTPEEIDRLAELLEIWSAKNGSEEAAK